MCQPVIYSFWQQDHLRKRPVTWKAGVVRLKEEMRSGSNSDFEGDVGTHSWHGVFLSASFLQAVISSDSEMAGTSRCWLMSTLTSPLVWPQESNYPTQQNQAGRRDCCSISLVCHNRLVRHTLRIIIDCFAKLRPCPVTAILTVF